MKRNLKLEWVYPHSAELVWECLTSSELIAQWLMQNDFKLEKGHKFQFKAKPMPGWSGIVDCEIKEIIENKKLSYSWLSGPRPGEIKIRTVVTWHLLPEQNGTRLVLEHTGFEGLNGLIVSYMLGSGWKGKISQAFANVLDKLATNGTKKSN